MIALASSRWLLDTHRFSHRVRRCDALTKRLQTYRIVPFQAHITNPLAAELLRLISCPSLDQYAINHDTPGSREIETKVEAARLADEENMGICRGENISRTIRSHTNKVSK